MDFITTVSAAILCALLASTSDAFVNHPQVRAFHKPSPHYNVVNNDDLLHRSNIRLQMSRNATISSSGSMGVTSENNNSSIKLKSSMKKAKMPKFERGGPVTPIHSTQEFLDAIEGAPKNGLIVVKYHANFCKVCARVILKFKKMANKLSKTETPVPISFIDVEITANPKICSTLNIKKFPFLQIYRNRECVTSFGTGPAHNFQRAVGGTVDQKLKTTEEEWEEFRSEHAEVIGEGLKKLELLRLDATLTAENSDALESNTDIPSDISP